MSCYESSSVGLNDWKIFCVYEDAFSSSRNLIFHTEAVIIFFLLDFNQDFTYCYIHDSRAFRAAMIISTALKKVILIK